MNYNICNTHDTNMYIAYDVKLEVFENELLLACTHVKFYKFTDGTSSVPKRNLLLVSIS